MYQLSAGDIRVNRQIRALPSWSLNMKIDIKEVLLQMVKL